MRWSLAIGGAVVLAMLGMWGSAGAKPPGGDGDNGGAGRQPPHQGARPCPPGDGEQSVSGRRSPGRPGDHRMPPPHPLEAALDADGDREISADEWNNAVAALKAADKNEDGVLDREELRPPLPPHGFGPPHGPRDRGPGGPREVGPRERGFGPPPGDGRGPRGESRRGRGQRPPIEADAVE